MNCKRALWLAFAAYVTTFILGLVFTAVANIPFTSDQALPQSFLVVQIAIMIFIGVVFTWWYFRSPSTEPTVMNGLLFGVCLIVVGFVLDGVLFIPALVAGAPLQQIISLYTSLYFWLALGTLILTTTLTGTVLQHRAKN